jgi:hypothetical protein
MKEIKGEIYERERVETERSIKRWMSYIFTILKYLKQYYIGLYL